MLLQSFAHYLDPLPSFSSMTPAVCVCVSYYNFSEPSHTQEWETWFHKCTWCGFICLFSVVEQTSRVKFQNTISASGSLLIFRMHIELLLLMFTRSTLCPCSVCLVRWQSKSVKYHFLDDSGIKWRLPPCVKSHVCGTFLPQCAYPHPVTGDFTIYF